MNQIDFGPRPLPDPLPRRQMTAAYLFAPVVLLSAVAGAVIALAIEDARPRLADGYVDITDHPGEILVVDTDGEARWTTEAELHQAAGHT